MGNKPCAMAASWSSWIRECTTGYGAGRKLVAAFALAASGMLTTGCAITNPRLPSRQSIGAMLTERGYRLAESSPQATNPKVIFLRWRRVERFRYWNAGHVDLLCDPKDNAKVLGIRTGFTLYNQSDPTRAHYRRFRRLVKDLTQMDTDAIPMRSYGVPSLFSQREKGSLKRDGLQLESRQIRVWAECTDYEFFLRDGRW